MRSERAEKAFSGFVSLPQKFIRVDFSDAGFRWCCHRDSLKGLAHSIYQDIFSTTVPLVVSSKAHSFCLMLLTPTLHWRWIESLLGQALWNSTGILHRFWH